MEIKEYRILMVDDDEEYLDTKAVYLMRKGYNIKTMSNPIEALEFLKVSNVDILIVDYFMPQMTGEVLIKNLRDLNKDIVVILQTGYAGQKPPKEMFEGITIQGYFNKNDGSEELEIITLSALRTAELMRIVKQNAEEKLLRNKKDKYFASKISWITGDIKESLFSMTGSVGYIDMWIEEANIGGQDKEEIVKRLMYLREKMENVRIAMESLNISSQNEITPNGMLEMVRELLKLELFNKKIKLNLDIAKTYCFLDMEGGMLPYIICQELENRINTDCEEISIIQSVEDNKVIIKILSEAEISTEQKQELRRVAKLCKSVEITYDNNVTMLAINKSM